jgi:hypothetical protein
LLELHIIPSSLILSLKIRLRAPLTERTSISALQQLLTILSQMVSRRDPLTLSKE